MKSITGIVRNTENTPLPDINVMIVSGPSHNDMAALTDARGRFSLSGMEPGSYVLKAYGPVESKAVSVEVLPEKIPFVEIWLE